MSLRSAARRALDTSPLDLYRLLMREWIRRPTGGLEQHGLGAVEIELLERMRLDVRAAGPPFTPSAHWALVVALFDELFQSEGIRNPEEQGYNLRFSGFSASHPRLHRYVCWMYRSILKKRDTLGLLDRFSATCMQGRGLAYRLDGDLVSLDLLLSIDDFYKLYELDPAVATEPVVVAELGAGWGRLGRVLCTVNPRCVYVVLDLPEVLMISQSYLPRLLPGATVRGYREGREPAALDRGALASARLWFLGPHDIRRISDATVDVIVNIASFQEMPVGYVEAYIRHFARVAAGGHCFLRQLRDGRSHGHALDEIAMLGEYPFPNDWGVRFMRSSTLSDEFFEVGFDLPPRGPHVGGDTTEVGRRHAAGFVQATE